MVPQKIIRYRRRMRFLVLLLVMVSWSASFPQSNAKPQKDLAGKVTLPMLEEPLLPLVDEVASVPVKESPSISSAPRKSDRSGESLQYDVFIGKVRVGEAVYQNHGIVDSQGQPLRLMIVETRLVSFNDREEIYSDPETFLPVLVKRTVSRLLKQEQIEERYNQATFVLNITRKRFSVEHLTFKKDGPIQNSILLPYVVRDVPELALGWQITANLPQRTYILTIAGIETVTVPAGTHETFHFTSEPAQLELWISTDKSRIPVKVVGSGFFDYRLELRAYGLPQSERAL